MEQGAIRCQLLQSKILLGRLPLGLKVTDVWHQMISHMTLPSTSTSFLFRGVRHLVIPILHFFILLGFRKFR